MKNNFTINLAFLSILYSVFMSACSYHSSPHYRATPPEVLQAALSEDYLVSPEETEGFSEDPSIALVDLRTQAEFARGHIDNAINIPTQNLLDPPSLRILRNKDKTIILYGQTELAANGPWMLLIQLGFDNVKVLQGGYAYWSDWEADGDYLTEVARYPYDSLFVLAIQRTRMEEEALRARPAVVDQSPAPQKEIVPQKKKVEKEEEEGC